MQKTKSWVAGVVMAGMMGACVVNVPDPYRERFACADNQDCLPEFECRFEGTSGTGYCAFKDDKASCSSNPCAYPLVCRDQPGGGYTCGPCNQLGCGFSEICVQSNYNGAPARCVRQCTSAGATCSTMDGGGWCVQVPGYPQWPSMSTQPVLACAGCMAGCTDCRLASPVISYDGATYCQTSAPSGCRYTGCTSGMTCVDSRPGGTPYCASVCAPSCGSNGACVNVTRAFNATGGSMPASVCSYCNPGCVGGQQCAGPSSVEYLTDTNPYCTSAPACSTTASCRDATACINSRCGDGSTCDPALSCAAGNLCYPDGACKPAACASDPTCPPQFVCGLEGQCAYAPNGAWSGRGSSDSAGIITGSLAEHAIALGPNGVPVVAWRDDNADNVYVASWDPGGNMWKTLDGAPPRSSMNNMPASHGPALVVDSSGRPVVAWIERGSNVYLKRWSGTGWQALVDGTLDSGGGMGLSVPVATPVASDVRVALMYGNEPVVAWLQQDLASPPKSHLYLRYWSGSTWSEISGSSVGVGVGETFGNVALPALALSPTGNDVVVAWTEYDSAYNHNVVQVRRSVGFGAWSSLPTRAIGGFDAQRPALAFDKSGMPVIAWEEWSPTSSIVNVEVFSGSTWQGLGFYASGYAAAPSLARDLNGDLLLAHEFNTGAAADIHLKHRKNSTWLELNGSASGAGISFNSTEASLRPSVAAGADACVAWLEGPSTGARLLVRCRP